MAQSFLFYDLETSGFNPRTDRVMQFAAQRTTLDLQPIGEPTNTLIRLSDDVLPSPDAVLVTGITPQKTRTEGVPEAEFLRYFSEHLAVPGTIFVGYNTVRFDDEFMRFMLYRNFYDAYEWQYKDNSGRWDLLDTIRMTRALRPAGINWPVDSQDKPTNRLELLATINKLDHANAHDALSDVRVTIELARLMRSKQPKLFDYQLSLRDKKSVAQLVNSQPLFVYTSGKYDSKFEKTTVVAKLCDHPNGRGVLVYDVRYDPAPYMKMSREELAEAWRYKRDSNELRLPIKTLMFNRCPAVAPLSVLDDDSQKRLQLDLPALHRHALALRASAGKQLATNVISALELLDEQQKTPSSATVNDQDVDGALYEAFFNDKDKRLMQQVRRASPKDLTVLAETISEPRLAALLPLYKARNFPADLTDTERAQWDKHVHNTLFGKDKKLQTYMARIEELATHKGTSKSDAFVLGELRLYGESLLP